METVFKVLLVLLTVVVVCMALTFVIHEAYVFMPLIVHIILTGLAAAGHFLAGSVVGLLGNMSHVILGKLAQQVMNEVVAQLLEQFDGLCCGTIKLDLACYECTNEEGANPWQYDKIGNPQETDSALSTQGDSALSTQGGLKLSSTQDRHTVSRTQDRDTVSRKIDQPASLRKRKGQIIYCVVPEISLGEQEQVNITKPDCAEGTEVYKGTDFQLTVRLSATAKFKIAAKSAKKANCLTRLAKLLPFSSPFPDCVQISDAEVKVTGSLGGHGFANDVCKVFAALRSTKKAIKKDLKNVKNIAQDGEKKLKNAISLSSAVLNKLKAAKDNAISSYTAVFKDLENKLKAAKVSPPIDALEKELEAFKKSPITAFQDLEKLLEAFKDAISSPEDAFQDLEKGLEAFAENATSSYTDAFNVLKNKLEAAEDAISSPIDDIINDLEDKLEAAVKKAISSYTAVFKDLLQEFDDVDDWLCEGFPSLNCCNPMVLTKQLESQLKELIDELKALGDKASTNPLDVSVTMGNTSTTPPGYDGKTPPAQKQVQQAVRI